ncbi:MAG: DUF424 family protein [Candidatus Aenigmarchaeota archaeon]|nr:DUF424 family protein [Candidatus Aenigmarchaeota archaeon]
MLKEAKIINLFGNRIVEIAVEQNLVGRENIKLIGGIAHAQGYKI